MKSLSFLIAFVFLKLVSGYSKTGTPSPVDSAIQPVVVVPITDAITDTVYQDTYIVVSYWATRSQWTEDAWPVLMPERYAAEPKSTITEQSLVGYWEQINLQYQYQVMQQSVSVVLTADKKVSGSISSVRSFDATKNLLTINGNKYIVTDA